MERMKKLRSRSSRFFKNFKGENRTTEDEVRTKKEEDRLKAVKNVDFNNYKLVTEFKEEKFSITWHIQSVHRCMLKRGEFLESSTFSTTFCDEVKWTLRMYPKGRNREPSQSNKKCAALLLGKKCEGAVGLFLRRYSPTGDVGWYTSCFFGMPPVTSYFRYHFSCAKLNSKNETLTCLQYPKAVEMDMNSPEFGTDALFCYCGESLEEPQALLVTCDIYVSNIFNMGPPNSYTCTAGLSKSGTLFQDLKELYESGRFSDITLQAGDVKFPTHKAILASRSNVFDAMFQHDMQESQTNVVKVHDIEPGVLRDMLHYIYTGNVNDFDVEKAMSLYYVSDKYSLDELKNWCVDIMLAKMTVENVCQIAVLADMHPNPKLKEAAFHVFRNNTSDIFKSKKWQELVENANCHALVTEILKKVSTSFVTNCDE